MKHLILQIIFFVCISCLCEGAPLIKNMTLEEKIGQLLIVHFNGEEVNEEAKILIEKLHVGGFIYYRWANGLHSPQQVRNLSAGLQDVCRKKSNTAALFIAVDQEGGRICRLQEGFTKFPSQRAIALTKNPEMTAQWSLAIGKELQSVGINFNLSPVVDINSNPNNQVIGDRSFSDQTDTVIAFAKYALQGYQEAGIISCLKHFPGHGDTEIDSHHDLPVLNKSKQELKNLELLPFAELSEHADTIMTAHLLIPSIDPNNCATLSKPILDILRKEIGFKGVVITDSLVMEGLIKNCHSIEEAAVKAFQAGCDLILLGGKQLIGENNCFELTLEGVESVRNALLHAVKSGQISEERLDESINRLFQLKEKHSLANPPRD